MIQTGSAVSISPYPRTLRPVNQHSTLCCPFASVAITTEAIKSIGLVFVSTSQLQMSRGVPVAMTISSVDDPENRPTGLDASTHPMPGRAHTFHRK